MNTSFGDLDHILATDIFSASPKAKKAKVLERVENGPPESPKKRMDNIVFLSGVVKPNQS